MSIIKIIFYTTSTGKQPFADWQADLEEKNQAVIASRVARLRLGNFGDCKIIKGGGGIWELRIDYGPGYRVYFGKKGVTPIILLLGGDKGSQARDITKAKQYWLKYKELSHD